MIWVEDEGYFNALFRVFEQALQHISKIEPDRQEPLLLRLTFVQLAGDNWGCEAGEFMEDLITEYGFEPE